MSDYLDHCRHTVKLKLISDNAVLDKLSVLKTDEQRFLFALETVLQYSATLFDPKCKQKDSDHAIKSREDGNKSFKISQYYKAVQEYTESIVYAVEQSEELTLAYANRSAALFKLEKYADCIDDIDRALSLKFPDKLKTKLYQRKGLSLSKLGRLGADSAFKEALVWLNKMDLNKAAMNKSRNELAKLISTPYQLIEQPAKVQQHQLPGIAKPSTEVPCASDAVAIKYTNKFGRHLVATRKIKPGEILAVEKPYCTGLIPQYLYKYCSYCLQVSWTLIPCKFCINVAYCSKACRDKAWEKSHEIECPVIGFLHGFELNEALRAALNTVIMATDKGKTINSLKKEVMRADSNKDPRTKGFSDDGRFYSDKYRSVYSLADNIDKKYPQQILARAYWVALTIAILARESNMFGKRLPLDTLAKNPDVVFVGGLILKQLHIGCVNMYSFGSARSESMIEHGTALMALFSLLNHSCDSNAFRQWYSGHMVLFAMYPIEQGEQIFDSYGPRYYEMPKADRVSLTQYWNFNCECIPCKEDWPLLHYLPSYEEQPISQLNKNKIRITLDILYVACVYSLRRGTIKITLSMLERLFESIEILCNLVQRPCKELLDTILIFRDFYQSANIVFNYETVSPSVTNRLQSISYSTLQYVLSQK